jgi:uncharacterized protein (TIGR02466 family)|tara:strand:+ start:657 stop:1259 length:603 start_codon:yes stop_codon:yes gene_type:complete
MKKSETKIIFGTPLATQNIDNKKLIKELLSYVKKLRKKDRKGRVISNVGGWQSKDLNLRDKPLVNLFTWINNSLTEFSQKYEFYQKRPFIENIWANVNGYKDSNQQHTHMGARSPDFSSVLYLAIKDGSIHFRNPDPYIQMMPAMSYLKPQFWNPCNSYEYYVTPLPGDLLIFPASIFHWVGPNMSKEDRITLSFNWSIK